MKEAHANISAMVRNDFTEFKGSERNFVFSRSQHGKEHISYPTPVVMEETGSNEASYAMPPIEIITPFQRPEIHHESEVRTVHAPQGEVENPQPQHGLEPPRLLQNRTH